MTVFYIYTTTRHLHLFKRLSPETPEKKFKLARDYLDEGDYFFEVLIKNRDVTFDKFDSMSHSKCVRDPFALDEEIQFSTCLNNRHTPSSWGALYRSQNYHVHIHLHLGIITIQSWPCSIS